MTQLHAACTARCVISMAGIGAALACLEVRARRLPGFSRVCATASCSSYKAIPTPCQTCSHHFSSYMMLPVRDLLAPLGYGLTVTGHSLGASTACLVTRLLQSQESTWNPGSIIFGVACSLREAPAPFSLSLKLAVLPSPAECTA